VLRDTPKEKRTGQADELHEQDCRNQCVRRNADLCSVDRRHADGRADAIVVKQETDEKEKGLFGGSATCRKSGSENPNTRARR
jgi:hypothetical protein